MKRSEKFVLMPAVLVLGVVGTQLPGAYASPTTFVDSPPVVVSSTVEKLDYTVFVQVEGVVKSFVASSGMTVGDVLAENSITVGKHDVVSKPVDFLVQDLDIVRIERKSLSMEVSESSIPFEKTTSTVEVECENPDATSEITTVGKNGVLVSFVQVVKKSDGTIERHNVGSVVKTPKVDEVSSLCVKPEPIEEPKASDSVAKTSDSGPDLPGRKINGTKEEWMTAAGIPEEDWKYVDFIVNKESSWNPKAVNPTSGACGLAQSYPCSKLGDNWSDPVVALKWQKKYVENRYGGYAGAYNFWKANNWY